MEFSGRPRSECIFVDGSFDPRSLAAGGTTSQWIWAENCFQVEARVKVTSSLLKGIDPDIALNASVASYSATLRSDDAPTARTAEGTLLPHPEKLRDRLRARTDQRRNDYFVDEHHDVAAHVGGHSVYATLKATAKRAPGGAPQTDAPVFEQAPVVRSFTIK